MSNNLNATMNNSAILAQVAKLKSGLTSTVEEECRARDELVATLRKANTNLSEDEAFNILNELDNAAGKLYTVDSIIEIGNPANSEKYAKYFEKYGKEIQLLTNAILLQQNYNTVTQAAPTPSPVQVGMNITPYVMGNQQPIQAVCVSGVQEIDNAIDLLAHPNMVAQMEAIAYNVFVGLAKKAPSENDKHTLAEMQNSVNATLGMLKDPVQITALKQAAGVMLSGDPKETKTIDSPFVDLVSQMLSNKCTCGHDHCTPNA